MIKVINNIMIVSVCIMLQTQSVQSSSGELGSSACEGTPEAWDLFSQRHGQLCSSIEKLIDDLKYIEQHIFLEEKAVYPQKIAALKQSDAEVKKLLDVREEELRCVTDLLPSLDEFHQEIKNFDTDSTEGGNGRTKVVLQDCVRCQSVKDAWEKVLARMQNDWILEENQKKYIDKILESPADSSDVANTNHATVVGNFQSYRQLLTDSQEMMKSWRPKFTKFLQKEESFVSASGKIQEIRIEEEKKIEAAVYRSMGIHIGVLFLTAGFLAFVVRSIAP